MKLLVTDELWERIEFLLPPHASRRFRFPGRKPIDNRKILSGILFVLKTGIAWDDLPAELGWGCGKTCRHYLQLWHHAGVWRKLHALLLAELNGADQIDWERALIDASFVKAARRWRRYRPKSHGSEQVRQQASCDDRRQRHTPFCYRDGGQRQRGHASRQAPVEHAAGRRQAGTSAAETG